jgi:hypothetical protein
MRDQSSFQGMLVELGWQVPLKNSFFRQTGDFQLQVYFNSAFILSMPWSRMESSSWEARKWRENRARSLVVDLWLLELSDYFSKGVVALKINYFSESRRFLWSSVVASKWTYRFEVPLGALGVA